MEEFVDYVTQDPAPKIERACIVRDAKKNRLSQKYIKKLLSTYEIVLLREGVRNLYEENCDLRDELASTELDNHQLNYKLDNLEELPRVKNLTNKISTLEAYSKKLENQLSTIRIDYKAREEMRMQEVDSLKGNLDSHQSDVVNMTRKMEEMDFQYQEYIKMKDQKLDHLYDQLKHYQDASELSQRSIQISKEMLDDRINQDLTESKRRLQSMEDDQRNSTYADYYNSAVKKTVASPHTLKL
mmetsp:Transcript_39208/g.44646  ORF Transcript_39208/g.44646 Transcript_39208/m.44646 type:complete len:242 (+) Transcript_39208:37-762(+)